MRTSIIIGTIGTLSLMATGCVEDPLQTAPPPPPPAAPTVVINEVESNGGDPGDWVELYNTGTEASDISGYIFRDNNDAGGYTLPAGSIVPPGGYLVLNEADFGFGLGAADMARLYLPDGNTIVNAHEWTAHATTTYGRCPNGSGNFATTVTPTKGAPNACAPSSAPMR